MPQPERLDSPWASGAHSPAGDHLPARQRRADQPHGHSNGYDRDNGYGDAPGPGPDVPETYPASAFERVPPQDPAAEQSVLGGMLLSKDAIADVVEVLKGPDFYKPAHETIYQAILDLYAKGEPADPITVADELTKRGELTKVGGNGYLMSLVQAVPTAANAEYYAEIVHERAVLRRLVEAGTRITQMGYAADGDVDDIVNSAQSEIYAVTEQRTSEDYLPLVDIMEGALDEIEAIGSRSGQMSGVPTGFADLDSLTNGLHPGQMIVIAARPAMGKALALDTPLPTPTGWTTMGEVVEGDLLLAADGTPTQVVATTDVLTERPCYRVTFEDGTTVVADADHQWLTESVGQAEGGPPAGPAVRTTKEIAQTLHGIPDGRPQHRVPCARGLLLPERELPLSPYALASWLGEDSAEAAPYDRPGPDRRGRPRSVPRRTLRGLGVLENRHIPAAYLRASLAQRRALLAGLLDTAGTPAGHTGAVRIRVAHRALAEGCHELVLSLGYRCVLSTDRVTGHGGTASTTYTVEFTPVDERRGDGTSGLDGRLITELEEVESVPVRCVQVDHPDHLYLATRSMIPTHNSTLALDFARACSIRNNLPSVIFSLEMGRNEIAMRLLSAEARVALHHMRSGSMTDEDWNRVARQMPQVTDSPLFIDDSPNLSMMEIRAKCRRLKQRNDLKLVVIDYLQLMQSGGARRPESRQQEVSDMSRNLKLLAKELEVPVIALSQLNRGPEQRTDKKPMVSDLRESGCVTAGTRVLRADTGAEVTMAELLASGERDVPVWSLDEHLRMVPRTMTHVFPSGRKEVFRMRLASGREIEASANHPFLTYDGWTPLSELAAGGRVAVPRRTTAPARTTGVPESEVTELARALATSQMPAGRPDRPDRPGRSTDDAPGRYGSSHGERLPSWTYALPDDQVRLLLRHLWATNGSVTLSGSRAVRVAYPTSSERLARGVQQLMLRLDISAQVRRVDERTNRPGWTVEVSGVDDQRRFLTEIGPHRDRTQQLITANERLREVVADTDVDTVPQDVWEAVREAMREPAPSAPRPVTPMPYDGSVPAPYAPRESRLRRAAGVLESQGLELLATSDVHWDDVVSIESLGVRDVYDATVLGTHNFVANGIHVHNSIEQDADMVILLHREDAYEKESPRAGEADLIVAKHRNGPTATITVAFQGHYSRFVNMESGL